MTLQNTKPQPLSSKNSHLKAENSLFKQFLTQKQSLARVMRKISEILQIERF
jgi:hypothetical protein